MIRIALRETRINLFFIIFATLGLSVLFAIIFVLLNFRVQLPDSYWNKYGDNYVLLESKTTELLDYQIEDLFIYARVENITYETSISYLNIKIDLPSYIGGICILSTSDSIIGFPSMLCGESFFSSNQSIWLAESIAVELGCNLGAVITLGKDDYEVKGIYNKNETPLFYETESSFFIYRSSIDLNGKDKLTAVISDSEQLMKLAKIDDGRLFDDKEGILELCRGFKILCVGIVLIICFFIFLLILLFLSIINIYLLKRAQFIRILFRYGISVFNLFFTNIIIFMTVAFFSCTLAIIWGAIFNSIILNWAENILNIRIKNPNYFIQWCVGMLSSFLMICVSLPISFNFRLYKREVSNQ